MKVECISDRVDPNIHDKWLSVWANTKEQLELTTGKVYVVLAIARYSNNFFFYILGDESDNYPLAFPAQFFKVKDLEISQFWEVNNRKIYSLEDLDIANGEILSFAEWKNHGDKFYENVLEEDKQTLLTFYTYRDKMLMEQREGLTLLAWVDFAHFGAAITPTGGFLRAERYLLESRGWKFNPATGAYHPPF